MNYLLPNLLALSLFNATHYQTLWQQIRSHWISLHQWKEQHRHYISCKCSRQSMLHKRGEKPATTPSSLLDSVQHKHCYCVAGDWWLTAGCHNAQNELWEKLLGGKLRKGVTLLDCHHWIVMHYVALYVYPDLGEICFHFPLFYRAIEAAF